QPGDVRAGVQGISRKENSHRRAYLPRQGLFYGKGALFLRSKREQTRAARSDLEARHARARIRRNRAFVSREDEKNLAWHRSDSLALPFEAVAPGGGIPSRGERGFTTAIHAVLWAASEEKIFRKYGLDVEYLALNTGRLGMQMLLADDIQVLFSTGVTVVSTNLQKGDLAIIGGGLNFFPTKLVTRPEIKKAADLKGKTLAVGGFGAANHMALLVALEKLGVNPK